MPNNENDNINEHANEEEALVEDIKELHDENDILIEEIKDLSEEEIDNEAVFDDIRSALEEELDSLKNENLKIRAEYDNFRRRSSEEKLRMYKLIEAKTVEKFLPVLDNFGRAMQAKSTDETFKEGMKLILSQLEGVLHAIGIEEIKALGEPFNPSLHNAVMTEESDYEPNTVIEVLQKGYTIGDEVLRYAMVKVSN